MDIKKEKLNIQANNLQDHYVLPNNNSYTKQVINKEEVNKKI